MTVSLQNLAIRSLFYHRNEEFEDLVNSLDLPQAYINEYHELETEKNWTEKSISVTSQFSSDITDVNIISSLKVLLCFLDGTVTLWNVRNSNKETYQLGVKISKMMTNFSSIVYLTPNGTLLQTDKSVPKVVTSSYTFSSNLRSGTFITPHTIAAIGGNQFSLFDIRAKSKGSILSRTFESMSFHRLSACNDNQLCVSSKSKKIDLLDLRKPDLIPFISCDTDRLAEVAVESDRVFTSTYLTSSKVKVWGSKPTALQGEMCIRDCMASSLAINSKEQVLLTGSQGGQVALWNISPKYPAVLTRKTISKGYPVIASHTTSRSYVVASRSGLVSFNCF